MTGRPPPNRPADLASAPASSADHPALPPDYAPASAKGAAGVDEAAQARLRERSERLMWCAYCRAIALQWAEPSAETAVICRAVFMVWKRTFLALAST